MNGKFEQNPSYPYSVQPEGGYGRGSDKWEVVDIRNGTVVSTGHASAVDASLAIPSRA